MPCVSGEIDYDEVTSDVSVTATGFSGTELMRVTVPAVPYPVYLRFELWAAAAVATVAATDPINTRGQAFIVPASAMGATAALSALGSDIYGRSNAADQTAHTGATDYARYANGLPTIAHGGPMLLAKTVRLPPDSPGDYVCAGIAPNGATRLWTMVGSTLYINSFWAIRGR